MPVTVMISYASDDTGAKGDSTASVLREALKDSCKVLIDTDCIEAGEDWSLTLNRMIESCDYLIPIISKKFGLGKAARACWTLREVQVSATCGLGSHRTFYLPPC